MFKIQFKLGKHPIAVEASDADEFFTQCGVFSKVPDKCGNCGSDDIRPHGEKKPDDDWVFHSIRCHGCGYQLRFGRRKDGELFLKLEDGWQEPYRAGGGNGASSSSRRYSGDGSSSHPGTGYRDPGGSGRAQSYAPPGGKTVAAPVDEDDDIPF